MQEQTNKIGHLNMIQGIISRMGNNAFSLKQWAVGIMIAIYAFAGENAILRNLKIKELIVFWFLDSYYLMIERKYRCLYDEVRKKKEKNIDFNMNTNLINVKMKNINNYCLIKVAFSKTIWPFYIVCIATTLIIYFIKF